MDVDGGGGGGERGGGCYYKDSLVTYSTETSACFSLHRELKLLLVFLAPQNYSVRESECERLRESSIQGASSSSEFSIS